MIDQELTYESAAAELNEILEALKNDEIGMDQLESQVMRASLLISYCKEKLKDTEKRIEDIVNQGELNN